MPACRNCGSEAVVWGKTANGKSALFDTAPRLHVISCPARPRLTRDKELVAALTALWGEKRARVLAGLVRGATLDDKILDAMHRVAAELERRADG